MINWPIGSRNSDGLWGEIWYEKVINSSSFDKYKGSKLDVPNKYKNIYDECLEIFNHMNKFSIK